jgi:replicative DNA helicase
MFIYREEYYNRETERQGIADIIVAKHRNGPIGDVEMTFLSRYPKFANIAHARLPAVEHVSVGNAAIGDGQLE